jgi:hypothetical protein
LQNSNASVGAGNTPEVTTRNGLRIREDVLYTNAEGKESVTIRNRADRAFKILGPTLQRILKPDETILYLFGAESRRGLLQMILRRFSFLSDTLLVITDKRIVALRVWSGTLGMKWTGSIRSVRWADVSRAKVSNPLIPTLDLHFRNGTSDGYWKIQRYDAKKLEGILRSRLLDSSAEQSGAGGPLRFVLDACKRWRRASIAAGVAISSLKMRKHCGFARFSSRGALTSTRRASEYWGF